MPWLCIHNLNGKDYYSVYPERQQQKRSEYSLGSRHFIEITEAEAALPLDKLTRLYKAEKAEVEKAQEVAKMQAEAKARLSGMLERFTRIIQESTQEGEVANAKVFYEKITGKPWAGQK